MIDTMIRADEIQPGDQLWTRTWYDTGMQPEEINGWRTVETVKVATRVTITFVDGTPAGRKVLDGPPITETRFPGDQVQVRKTRLSLALTQTRRSEPRAESDITGRKDRGSGFP